MKKQYYLPGLIIFFILFLLSTILNFDFTYMGNKSDKVTGIVINYYLFTIILQAIKILVFYLFIGIILNCIFYTALKELQKRFNLFKVKENKFLLIFTIIGLLLYTFIFFSKKILLNPQLYLENFAGHSRFFKSYLFFLTDYVGPIIPVFLLSIIYIFVISLFILSADWMKLIQKIFNLKKYFYFRYSKLIIILVGLISIFVILYENNIIFYNKTNTRPNILIISADALRPDHLSFNRYKKKTTPNIDSFAEKSLQIRGTFTALPRTFPAWVSILSSKYPMTHGINHMFPRTRERNIQFDTAVSYLNEHGYRTAVISDFAGDIFPRIEMDFKKVIAPQMNTTVLIKQIMLEKQTFLLPFITNKLGLFLFPEIRDFAKLSFSGVLTEETINEIDSSRGEPFFIVTFYSVTHFPYAAPYPYFKKFSNPEYKGQHKYLKDRILNLDNNKNASKRNPQDASKEDKEQVNALYDGCLNLLDNEFGKIIEYLKKKKLFDNTIVIITSDHGENLYEKKFGMGHGEHLKGNYSLEIPLIIHYPKIDEKGKTIKRASSSIDIMPTVFDIAGLKIPDYFDGISILKKSDSFDSIGNNKPDAYCETGMWFDNDKSSPLFFHHQRIDYPDISGVSEIDFTYKDEVVISQKYQNIVNGAKYRAIYSGRYKLIYIPLKTGPKFELYDYLKDPDNENDLSANRKNILDIMKKKFYNFIDEKSAGNYLIKNGILFPAFADPVF